MYNRPRLAFLRDNLHVSWLVAWLAGGTIAGITVAAFLHAAGLGVQLCVMGVALLVMGFINHTKQAAMCMIAAGMCFGLARGSAVQAAYGQYASYYGRQVQLHGTVHEDPSLVSGGEQRVVLGHVAVDGSPRAGTVWVSTVAQADIKRGDVVTFAGVLNQGFGTVPAAMFRARMAAAERPEHGDVARELRDWFASGVRRAVSEPEASLGVGYLVGQRSALPQDLDAQLRLLGLTHAVVASGYNLTILVRFARRRFAGVSKYLATASAAAMIMSFMLVTGFSPSMSRAGLVTGLSLAAWYFGRNLQPMVILPLAAAATALINPSYVWGDIGWYLSFTSFAGIMLLAPLAQRYFWGQAEPSAAGQVVLETMSAQIVTLPIIAFVFGQYSPLALLANLLVIPLIPLTMVLTFAAGLAGVLAPGIAGIVGWPAQAILHYMVWVTDTLAVVPGAAAKVTFTAVVLAVSYVVLIALIIILWRKTEYRFGQQNIVE